jgi:hypothetical protein
MILEEQYNGVNLGKEDSSSTSRVNLALNLVISDRDAKSAEGGFYLHYPGRGTFLLTYTDSLISFYQDYLGKLNHVQSFTFYHSILSVEPIISFPDIKIVVFFKTLNFMMYVYEFETHTLRHISMLNILNIKTSQSNLVNFSTTTEKIASNQSKIMRSITFLLFFESPKPVHL